MFFVVKLDSDIFKEKIVVPTIWLDKHNTLCLIPPVTKLAELQTLAKIQSTPKHGWQMHSVSFIQNYDTYSQAEEAIKKSKPVTVELEEEEDNYKEKRGKRKRKLPPFLEQYSIETDDDDDEVCNTKKYDCSAVETNVKIPHPLIVKTEPTEDSTHSQCHQPPRPHTTHNKSYNSMNSSFLLENHLQATGSNLFNTRTSNVKLEVTKCPCNSACHSQMFQSIAALQRQLEDNNRMIYRMYLVLAQGTSTMNALPVAPSTFPVTLPVTELSGLQSLNTYLSEEPNFSETIPYFTGLGGNTPRQILKKIMEAFLSKELGVKLNWKGRGDKNPFNIYTKIHSLVYHIAKQNPKTTFITLAEVESFIKDWLKLAPIRYVKAPKKSLDEDDKILRC